MKKRLVQVTLIASTLCFSWLGMQIVHELGHVLTAYAVGAKVHKVVLHPLAISRADVSHDRYPLAVIWGGPILGVLLPLALLTIARRFRRRPALIQFFAGFCLIANGLYLSAGSLEGIGDAGDLIRHGSPIWLSIAFGLACAPAGLWLWHGLGPAFGLGRSNGQVEQNTALWAFTLAITIITVELLVGSR